jgi:hypothetical protein
MDDSDFTTTGTGTVTLASAANLNDIISIVSFESNIPDNDYVPASGGTFTGAVTHSGAITLSGNVSGATTFTDQVTFGTSTNLLSNAEFTTNTTGWTATGSSLAIVSNELQLTPNSGVNGFANQQVDNLVVGRSYIASVTVTVDAGSLTRLYIGTSANGNQTVTNMNLGTGTHSFIFTATATTHHFALVVGGGTGQVTRFDNAKLVEANKVIFPAGYGKVDGILAVDRASSFGKIIDVQKDGTSVGAVGSPYGGELYIQGTGANSSGLLFTSGNSIQPRKNSAADDGNIDIGASGNKFKNLYLSSGIYLGGTGSANHLDDYEEGTWTPTVGAITGQTQPTVTAGTFTGNYTKIGSVVVASFYVGPFQFNSTGSSSTLAIKGFPFVGDPNKVSTAGPSNAYYYISWARPNFVSMRHYTSNEFGFLSNNNGATWGWEACSAAGTGAYRYIIGSMTYFTNA